MDEISLNNLNNKVDNHTHTVSEITDISNLTSSSGGFQMYTKNGTFIVPNNITKVKVTCVGGAGGGGGSGYYAHGGNGATGFIAFNVVNVTPGQSIPIIVGKGGVGGGVDVDNGYDGDNGKNTSFGNYVTAAGGNGGGGATYTNNSSGTTTYLNGSNAFSYSYRYGINTLFSIGGVGGITGTSGNVGTAGTAGYVLVEW